jgi:hypothetical protein
MSDRLFWAIVATSVLVRFGLAWFTAGTNDMLVQQSRALGVEAGGVLWVYEADKEFNMPPMLGRMLYWILLVQRQLGVTYAFAYRFFEILADLGCIWLVSKLAPPDRVKLAVLAISPMLVLVSAFHGNHDPAMIFFLLLAVYMLTQERVLEAGFALGAAGAFKIVPILFVPAALISIKNWRSRFFFLISFGLMFAAMFVPEIWQNFPLIKKNIFDYKSMAEVWGYTRVGQISENLTGRGDFLMAFGTRFGRLLLLVSMTLAAYMSRNRGPFWIFASACTAFFVFTPGFGVQYLFWLAPFTVLLSLRHMVFLHAATGVFMVMTYHFWSDGQWYFANAADKPLWAPGSARFQLLAWFLTITAMVSLVLGRHFKHGVTSEPQKLSRAAKA